MIMTFLVPLIAWSQACHHHIACKLCLPSLHVAVLVRLSENACPFPPYLFDNNMVRFRFRSRFRFRTPYCATQLCM